MKFVRNRLLMSAAIASIATAHPAAAADFFITFPVFVTNGGNNIDGNDSLTITVTGSITTVADFAHGVYATGASNTIANSGSIATGGARAVGIFAYGDSNTIANSGSIATGGSNTYGILAFGDSNTITNSGSIATGGSNAYGIFAYGDSNTIANSGSIATAGSDSDGIVAYGDSNTISNSGSIGVGGSDAYGILAVGYSNTISNSGSIVTGGDRAFGIFALGYSNNIANSGSIATFGDNSDGIFTIGDYNTIANSGSIVTGGANAVGIYAYGDSNTITNSGSIATAGSFSPGIVAGNGNTITNSGSIRTTGMYAYGISGCCANTIVNSGTVETFGFGAIAIAVGDNNTITNSGRVVSAQNLSFALGVDNTLNLLAPSFIGGPINLGANALVNVVTGPPHDILWDFSTGTMNGGAPNISGTMPFFYNPVTKKLATFNPAFLGGAGNALADVSGNLSALMQSRLNGGGAGLNSNLNAFVSTQEAQSAQRIDQAFEREGASSFAPVGAFWIAAFGSQADYENAGTANDYRFRHHGYAIGYDRALSPDLTVGALAGWGETDRRPADAAGGSRLTGEGWFAAVFARRQLGAAFFDAGISGGTLDHASRRFVNDNLAPLGVSYASASYDSWWWSPEAAVGVDLPGAHGWTYTPSARIRYASQSIDGYVETGAAAAANAAVGARDVEIWEGRAQIAASRQMDFGPFAARLGILSRSATGDGSITVGLNGQTAAIALAGNDVTAGFAGVDAKIQLIGNFRLDLDGEFVFGGDTQGARGFARLVAEF